MTFSAELVFVRILLPFVAGIYCAYTFPNSSYILPCLLLNIGLLVSLLTINVYYKKLKIYQSKGITGLFIHLFWFTFGGLICLLHTQSLRKIYFANQPFQYLKVWINNEPQQTDHILRFEVNVTMGYLGDTAKAASGKLLIALKTDSTDAIQLNYGDELLITAANLPIEPAYNPAEFDFKAWLASKNMEQQTFINQNQLVKLNAQKGNSITRYAIQTRQEQVAIYRKLIRNDEAFAVASTLVLGYRADLSKETLAAYSKTGTIHALSVSGMHVGIIYIFLNWALYFLDRNKTLKIIKLFFICGLIWYYSLLTGFSPSVLRSAVMLSIYILAKAFNRSSNNYNILAFTAFCLLVYDPFLIWDVGFQLSFLAVFGLMYLQPKIYKWLYIKHKWLDKLWATVALSLAAQMATFPLSIYYFHQFPLYFILSNLFILLPLTLMMYLGIGILILRLYFIAPIFEWIINFTNNGLKWIATLPFAGITDIWLNKWQLMLLIFALSIFILALVHYHKKLLLISLVSILIFQCISAYNKIIAQSQKKILFFSLRKNYAAAFIEDNHAVLLSDLTSSDKSFDFFIRPALAQLQVKNIHFVNWKQDTILNSFIKSEQQISFHQYHILLVDSRMNYKKIESLPKFETLWLHQNPKKSIGDLRTEVLFSNLVIDASNKDHQIERYKKAANKIQVETHILKKNNSYLIDLNRLKSYE